MQRMLAIAAAMLLTTTAVAVDARAFEIVALDAANGLVRFDSARPGEATAIAVTGVRGTLVGIDRRPANRLLYALSDANDLYTIEAASGVARAVSTLTVAFDGGPRSGFDFNPQSDRLRLVGGNGQNLRVNVDLGAAATDTPLRYATSDPNAGKRPAIAALAYTNAMPDAAVTKLFDIDSELDVLVLQDPPNDGALVTIGPLGVDFDALAGFDIVTEDGVDRGFAVSRGMLYEIDMATGSARALGAVGTPSGVSLIGLTIVPASDPARSAYPAQTAGKP